MRVHDFFENKIKGADGKACWDGYRYNGTKDGKDSCVKVDEARADVNFDAEDLKRLERINDLETLKTQAFALISKPSAKPMKPEKVSWFRQALASKSNKIAVIKMMYDLMLSGEGNSVVGSRNSMSPNSYRKVFNSATSEGIGEAYQNDEANLWYIYDTKDGRLKQKMIDNLDEPRARSMGYRDSIDAALRVANIIRSKFDAKKFVQKQGNQWVPVYPFGQQGVAEGVAETLPLNDALKLLRQYGADHFKTGSEILKFYKDGRAFSVNLIWNDDATRSVSLSQLNSATRGLKGQGVAEAGSPAQQAAIAIAKKKQNMAESPEDMTPNWAKYVLDQLNNSNGSVTMTDLFDEHIPGLRDMFYATAQEKGLDPEEDFQDVEHEVMLKLEDIINGGHGMEEAFASPPPFKDMIASVYQPKVGDSIRTRKGGQIPGTVEKVADHNGIEYCWFRHPEGKLYKTPCSNVMRG